MAAALALPPQAGSMEASERGAGGDTRAPQGRGSPAEREREREAALLQQLLRRRGPEPGPALSAAGGEEGPGPGPGPAPGELPLAELVRGLRGESPALRGEALRGLRRRLARPGPGAQALRALVEHGLESAEPALRTATALLLPALLGPPLPRGLDLGDLTLSLARKLGAPARPGGGPGEEAAAAFSSLRQLGETLGPERFHGYLGRLPSALRGHYNRLREARLGEDLCGGGDTAGARPAEQDPLSTNLKFGLIPHELHGRLLDQEDYKNRTQAVEELKQVLTDAASASLASTPAPSLLGLISFLYTLLDDSNFKVVHGTLEVLHLLALRLGERVQAYLGPLVSAAAKVLGDNKLAIRQEYSQLFWCLMKAVGPQQVLCLLLQPEHLQHKNSKVREEVVNICIGSLLTYPSEDFDLPKLAFGLAPALVDSKRRVRHAALEAFAVLASSMGSGKTSLLFKAVDAVELQDNGDGVMHAVQARLARKTLPKLTDQGFVEYAVPMPSSAHGRGVHLLHGADTDWLLAGNRTQSAHSYCGDHTRDATQNYGSHSPYTDQGICPRRVLSAGKGKNKLPWENERAGGTGGGCSGNQTPFTKGIEQMQSSLRSLRNSAAKKRAKLSGSTSDLESPDSALKLDLTMDSPSRTSSPNVSSYSESGVYSQESLTSPVSTTPQGKITSSDIFPLLGCKSCPARLSSARNRSTNVVEQSSSAGVTFHDKSTSNVSIIGQRLNYGNGSGDYEDDKQREVSPCVFKGQNKEHQRHCKPTKGFTGSTSSLQQINNLDFISPSALSEDSVVIVGKGVFGSPPSAPLTYSQSMISCVENGDVLSLKQGIEPLSGIYGRAVQQNSAPFLDSENEKDMKVAMSKSARDKMRQKKKEEKEQSHKEHQEVNDVEKKEQNPWERLRHSEPEKMATESLSFYGDALITSKDELLSFEDVAFSTPLKRTSSLRQTQSSVLLDSDETSPGLRGQYKDRTPSVTHSPEIMDPSELRPFSKPETALTEALRLLADDDWEKKIEGLNFVRCLSAYHADVLTGKLHETSLAVVQEVKNLRSGVSRAAVVCLGDLFTYLKKSMDQELDSTVKVLLHKAGESNTFIREDVDKALKAMVNNVTPARALCSLINGGQSHLHTAVRRCTAQHLSDVVERMGPGRILSGIKDVTDRILPAVARFAQDGSQETRYYGRKMLFSMTTHPDFDKMLEKYVPSKDLPYIKESVSSLRQKGLGEMPLDTPSAKGRRSHTGSIGHSRSSSTSRDVLNITEREITEVREITRKPVARNSLESAEYVKVITSLLNAKDFRDRINGIKQLLSDTENNQDLVVANIVKIFDAFKSRLHDSNSKVNQVALETMYKMIPLLKDNLSPVINMLIPAMVDNNLNSKNPGIYAAATNVIQALCQHLDNYLLLQPFCTKAQFLNGKAKQDMTEKLADLVMELYPRKPHAIEQKVLVVLWHLLGNMTNSGSLPGAGGNIRTATAKLSKALFAQMGQSLLIQAASQPPHIKKNLEEFLDIAT
nr:TOG array regulator of axonemal microtubules protein 1 isoform X6 [Caretta caretta]